MIWCFFMWKRQNTFFENVTAELIILYYGSESICMSNPFSVKFVYDSN